AVQSTTRFTQNSVPVARSATAPATPYAVHLAVVATNAPGNPRLATGVSVSQRAYCGVSLPGPANTASTGGTLRSKGDAYPGWGELGCSLSVQGAGTFGAPALPTGAGTYALGTGDVAASGKALIGALSALPASPTTLYVGGTATVTGALTAG